MRAVSGCSWRLIAEHSDIELARVRKNVLQAGHSRHAVANDAQLLHGETPAKFVRSTRTEHCLKFGSREIGSNALCVT